MSGTNSQSVAFPRRLYELLNNESPSIVAWDEDGMSFRIVHTKRFISEVIPKYFRHSKLTSFQRQLNLYGFNHYTRGEDAGVYLHPNFQRDHPELLGSIKRTARKKKTPVSDASSDVASGGRQRGLMPQMSSQLAPRLTDFGDFMTPNNWAAHLSSLNPMFHPLPPGAHGMTYHPAAGLIPCTPIQHQHHATHAMVAPPGAAAAMPTAQHGPNGTVPQVPSAPLSTGQSGATSPDAAARMFATSRSSYRSINSGVSSASSNSSRSVSPAALPVDGVEPLVDATAALQSDGSDSQPIVASDSAGEPTAVEPTAGSRVESAPDMTDMLSGGVWDDPALDFDVPDFGHDPDIDSPASPSTTASSSQRKCLQRNLSDKSKEARNGRLFKMQRLQTSPPETTQRPPLLRGQGANGKRNTLCPPPVDVSAPSEYNAGTGSPGKAASGGTAHTTGNGLFGGGRRPSLQGSDCSVSGGGRRPSLQGSVQSSDSRRPSLHSELSDMSLSDLTELVVDSPKEAGIRLGSADVFAHDLRVTSPGSTVSSPTDATSVDRAVRHLDQAMRASTPSSSFHAAAVELIERNGAAESLAMALTLISKWESVEVSRERNYLEVASTTAV